MARAHHIPPLEIHTVDDVIEAVRERGGRLTTPRKVVVEALFAADAPLAAEAMASDLQLELTSVYRTLDLLEGLGIVRHVHLGHGPGLYALHVRGVREYLVCERCDRVASVPSSQLDGVRDLVRKAFDFEADFGHFPILGVCAECRVRGTSVSAEPQQHHDHEH